MLMLVRPQPGPDQRIEYESRWTEPQVNVVDYVDSFGNTCWRFTAPAGAFRIRYDALVAVSGAPDEVVPDAPLVGIADVPDAMLVYTLPSRFIQSDLLVPVAWELFGATEPSWARVQAICDWVHSQVSYRTGSSDPSVTAMDVFEHLDDPLEAIDTIDAALKPGGYVYGRFDCDHEDADRPQHIQSDFASVFAHFTKRGFAKVWKDEWFWGHQVFRKAA